MDHKLDKMAASIDEIKDNQSDFKAELAVLLVKFENLDRRVARLETILYWSVAGLVGALGAAVVSWIVSGGLKVSGT